MGKNRGAGETNQFISAVKELEERILWLIREYRNFIDLLAMGRKGGQHNPQKGMVEGSREAPKQPRM